MGRHKDFIKINSLKQTNNDEQDPFCCYCPFSLDWGQVSCGIWFRWRQIGGSALVSPGTLKSWILYLYKNSSTEFCYTDEYIENVTLSLLQCIDKLEHFLYSALHRQVLGKCYILMRFSMENVWYIFYI